MANDDLGERTIAKDVQPPAAEGSETAGDILEAQLEELYDEVDRQIKAKGFPTDEELRANIEQLNRTATEGHK